MNAQAELTLQELEAIRESRLERARLDLRHLDLSGEYLEALLGNPSADLPYHGNQHQLAVASLALRGAAACHGPQEKRPALLIAGLFHDYGYSLTAEEPENIEVAVAAAQLQTERHNPELTEVVRELIRATEFPHRRPGTQSAAILQDADLLMIALPDYSHFLRGLARERPDFVPDPLFPGEAALKTNWAKRIYATAWSMQLRGERIADPDSAVAVGGTFHLQRLSSRGFLVDSSIADGLESLWEAGFETVYSCGGDEDGRTSPGFDSPVSGYIAFSSVSPEQLIRLERAALAIDGTVEHFANAKGPCKVIRFANEDAKRVFEVLLYS